MVPEICSWKCNDEHTKKMGVWQYYKRCIILYIIVNQREAFICGLFLLIHSVHYASSNTKIFLSILFRYLR